SVGKTENYILIKNDRELGEAKKPPASKMLAGGFLYTV
ncbi:MAG: hypothetical protein ACI9G6_000448, partial [Limisphaerales bacterium]